MKTDPSYGSALLAQWMRLYFHKSHDSAVKLMRMHDFFNRLLIEWTDSSGLQFHTIFTRMAYLGTQVQLPPGLLFHMHSIRKEIDHWLSDNKVDLDAKIDLMARVGNELIVTLYQCKRELELEKQLPPSSKLFKSEEKVHVKHIDLAKVVITAINDHTKILTAIPEGQDHEVLVAYDITGVNDNFKETIQIVKTHFTLPISMSLLDISVDEKGIWTPMGMVLLPDYLLDVTAVAESIKSSGVHAIGYLLKKFLPMSNSLPILTGNIVNNFLDEMVSEPDVTFRELKEKLFRLAPLSFAGMGDETLRNLIDSLKIHYYTLFQLVKQGFKQQGIYPEKSVLEPTFYSDKFGLQGRLDMFFPGNHSGDKPAIVELKSGQIYKPNKYGLNASHYIQTLLYDLLIQSVYEGKIKPTSYILYSKYPDAPLRFAPVVKVQQYEALAARNELIGIDWQLSALNDETDIKDNCLARINDTNYPGLYGFDLQNVKSFEQTYHQLSELEKRYFVAFTGMIAREHQLAKIGLAGKEGMEGQAALWQKSTIEKEQSFELLKSLELLENKSEEEDPLIILKRSEATNDLANFRTGDIVVLYPSDERTRSATADQLIKCSIVHIDETSVHLRLRARQTNADYFKHYKKWNIEQDLLDSSFLGLSRALYEWAVAPATRRAMVLGLQAPRVSEYKAISLPSDLTEEQRQICSQILQSKDYFLLWGPPGTGKTSKMLHHIVRYLLLHTEEKLLLMAYTNRAVDEICHAIESIDESVCDVYVRIGSRYGAAESYRRQLLDRQAQDCKNRKELLDLLAKKRIVVGTLASIQGKQELFDLIPFDRLIVDEASQILEPSMAGMMVRFEKILLIGDHQQLPAVVSQAPDQTRIKHDALIQIGLTDLRDSLFERLYKRAIAKEWTHAYALLSHQGRMHQDIMAFPNEHFYAGSLKVLPLDSSNHFQKEPLLKLSIPENASSWAHKLAVRRVNFIPSRADEQHVLGKVNRDEAQRVVEIIRFFQFNAPDGKADIGVITPYRAQIATITHEAIQKGVMNECILVDTVERFQGGAKDIIIISLCVNYDHQLKTLVSLSSEGIDRKFNVALTRARRHLVVLGNPDILRKDERYRAFMANYRV